MSAGAEIVPFDLARMFLGEAPPLFLLEVLFRTAVMFTWLLLLLRVLGKRGLAQLSTLEFALVIALGSAAGDPMFYPEVPLLPAMLVLALVVLLQRALTHLLVHNARFELLMEGRDIELVRNGVLDRAALDRAKLSREDLFERLRANGVRQLGEVQRAYFEQDSSMTVFCHREPTDAPAGLPIVPPWSIERPAPLPQDAAFDGPAACLHCGRTQQVNGPLPTCACGTQRWTAATRDPLASTRTG